jgi:endo-1,4-beta-D-glucanase Y
MTSTPLRLPRAGAAALLAAALAACAPGDAERPVLRVPEASAQQPKRYRCAVSMAPSQAAADAEIRAGYAEWKRRYLTAQGSGGGLRVRVTGSGRDRTLSEGMGYGMLLAAYLDDRTTFDGLWRYAKLHHNPRGLMAWEVTARGHAPDPNAATDGDADMAFALVVADRRWGAYRADTEALIRALFRHTVEPGTFVVKPGDVWGGSAVTNPSYFSPAYYRVFAEYTRERGWLRVVDANYAVLARIRRGARTGLLPGWTTAAGDSATAGDNLAYMYDYGSARIPWRLAKDAAWNCDPRARAHVERLNAFFRGVGAKRIVDGYRLDGRPTAGGHNAVFVAPAAAGAMLSPDARFRAEMWNETVALRNDGYYADSLRLLALLLASGNMQPPAAR